MVAQDVLGRSPRAARAELAQVNVAWLRADLEAPAMGGFLAALTPVNLLADASPGFVWRLRSKESHGAVTLPEDDHMMFVNLSVWVSYEALHDFVYRSSHAAFVRQRRRWFVPAPGPTTALWWVEPGERPTVADALRRLRSLGTYGPTPQAFGTRRRFDCDGRPSFGPSRPRYPRTY